MIVINYRRSDAGGYPLYLHSELSRQFGKAHVFLDVGGQLTGAGDYTKAIFDKIERCRVLICMIGPTWLTTADESGQRLYNPDDLVRREIDLALQRNKIVLPVLLNGAQMPNRHSLPDCISEIVKYDAVSFRHERYEADAANIILATRKALASRAAQSSPASRTGSVMHAQQALEDLRRLTNAFAMAEPRPNALVSAAYPATNALSDSSFLGAFEKSEPASPTTLADVLKNFR